MATLVFAGIGAMIGGGIGGTFLGIGAAAIGQAAGAMIGNAIDRTLLAPTQKVTGPRLDSVDVQTSAEGTGLPVVEGVGRVGGSIIWATRLEEVKKTSKQGGKGGGPKVESTEYSYYANFAVALTDCSTGPLRHLGRIWADGKLLDTSDLTIRFYRGTDTQAPDPLMVAKDGAAPAYRGTSYVVFERMPVNDYGRRIPSLSFEVWGPSGQVETLVRGVDLNPGATEFGYSPTVITAGEVEGEEIRQNAVRNAKTSDWTASLDMLRNVLPNCRTVALVVSWFGTDLRAAHCRFMPKVETRDRKTSRRWRVAGLDRDAAPLVSYVDGLPAFGSTPDDLSVIEAIRDLKARGYRVVLYPSLLMDLPAGNALPGFPSYRNIAFRKFVEEVYPANPEITYVNKTNYLSISIDGISITQEHNTLSPFYGSIYQPADGGRQYISTNIGRSSYKVSAFPDNEAAFVAAATVGATMFVEYESRPGARYEFKITKKWAQQINTGKQFIFQVDADFMGRAHGVDANDGGGGQPVYPWRGRIRPSSADGPVAGQIAALVGTAAPGHFPAGTGVPSYTGPVEWSYRRYILHLAALARNAGGVDAFLIGSELVGLTTATDAAGVYPFVSALKALAADVKSMLPSAKVSYAADWSEYHSHRNGAEVFFHLDPLWSDPSVDFIGIDNHLPLSDWRPGVNHLDYDPAAGITSPYCLDYLKGQVEGGEYWSYCYKNEADRDAQIRTPITDAQGEPWVFRQKAIRDWWANSHRNRPKGVRSTTATAWVPSSKPVWFTEYGCPAVNLGANQPNVSYDARSSEAALPYFSNGARDDFMQRQYLRALLEWWGENGGSMLRLDDALAGSWDARPWPDFPRSSAWADGPNWSRGHALSGRLGACPARETLERRLAVHYGVRAADMDLSRCFGQADGAIIPGPLSFRDALATWETALRLDATESGGVFRVSARSAAIPAASLSPADLVEDGSGPLYTITRQSLEDVPRSAVVRFSDAGRDYESGAARAVIRENAGEAEAEADLALVSDLPRMTAVAETMLRAAADERETVEFALPPSSTIQPGQVFTLTPRGGRSLRFIALDVSKGAARKVRASLYSGAVFGGGGGGPGRPTPAVVRPPSGTVVPYLLDLPILPGLLGAADHQGFVAFFSNPWPGGADLFRSIDAATGYGINLRAGIGATVGVTTADLPRGQVGVWSGERLSIRLSSGSDMVSRSAVDVLAGGNAMALEHAPGVWEVIQWRNAEILGGGGWHLSGLLRGQAGTEWTRGPAPLPAGARVVVLDAAILPVDMTAEEIGRPFNWKAVPAGRDPADAPARPHTFAGVGRRPYAPAHLRARRAGSALVLDWKRRTRREGDAWLDKGDVPLAEVAERYLVEVGPAAAPLRSLEVSSPGASLDVAGLSGSQVVRVAQVSDTFGPGAWATLTVAL